MSVAHYGEGPPAAVHHAHHHPRPKRVRAAGLPDTPGPLPIVVGVTGHRDLRPDDVPALEEAVRRILLDLRSAHPHSPLLLLSPLAEGSDRLVARVALEAGLRLIVPLPLPLEVYEQDFQDDASRAEFRQLLAAAESSYVVPLAPGNTAEGISTHGDQRNRQYAQVGALIARQSQLFLALWDGIVGAPDENVGGTADVVRFRLEGVPTSYDPSAASALSFSSSGPVHHIVTPRAGRPAPDRALTTTLLLPVRQGAATSHDDLQWWMDQFNEDALRFRDEMSASRAASKAQLLQVGADALPDATLSLPHAARVTLEHYAVADTLAVHFAAHTRAASRKLFAWVFVSALFFNLFHSLPHPHISEHPTLAERLIAVPWLLLLFLAASIVASYWIHRDVTEQDYQNKHQDYRALAEALRIQFFWQLAGVPDRVVDHYLRKQRGALEWIRSALRAWDAESMAYSAKAGDEATRERLALVAQHWVTEQRNYFAGKARREQATLEAEEARIERLVRASVALALLLAVVLTLPLFVPLHALEAIKHWVEDPWIHGLVMIAIVTLAVIAGLRHAYNQQMARSEHAKQFGRMSELFDAAQTHLAAQLTAGNLPHAVALLRELGQEALEENGDWVLLHRERPLEVPHSG
jgi:hypothetical protein